MCFFTTIITVAQLIFIVITYNCVNSSDGDFPNTVMWAKAESLNFKHLEPAGNLDEEGYDPIYVVRALIEKKGSMPGFISNKSGSLGKIPTGKGQGISVPADNVTLLYAPRGSLSWVELSEEGEDPKRMIIGGQMPGTREIVYICRALVGQLVIPGAYVPERNACVVSDGRGEEELEKFEVLTFNEYAVSSGIII